MNNLRHNNTCDLDLVEALSRPSAYPCDSCDRIEMLETHISWVFLTEKHAYKVKKPVRNLFLDYSTLERRKHFCHEELRLDSRYAPELYIAVVPITFADNSLEVGGRGPVCEYAVKMHRFPSDALLSQRLVQRRVKPGEIKGLSERLANFHRAATLATPNTAFGEPTTILREAIENFDAIQSAHIESQRETQTIADLRNWTNQYFKANESRFRKRKQDGFIRECHGDLHSGNVVFWNDQFTPFDGIEFNDSFRWIDVLSDAAFLAMDLLVRKNIDLSSLFVSSYLEHTGDYSSPELLRWYMVFRALVRAKVACMLMSQHDEASQEHSTARRELSDYLEVASKLTKITSPKLWITHGVSGSGKSTGAEAIVQREGAIRIRADVERKRLVGQLPDYRPGVVEATQLYSTAMTERTYTRLRELASRILQAGFSVVVDATFLKRSQREQFARSASEGNIPFRILDFQADFQTLRQRIVQRQTRGADASDADCRVLSLQFENQEPLDESERQLADIVPPNAAS